MSKICGVYLIKHIASGLQYVGQSRDIKKRWRQHSMGLCKMRLGRAISAHGWESFSAEILELCEIEQLNAIECKWIAELNSLSPNGFNLNSGGKQPTVISQETRDKISKSQKGKVVSAESKAKMSERGKNRSCEHKQNLSAANQARIYTPELIAKMGAGNKGRKFSELHRARISAAGFNRPPTTLGMRHTAESKAKMSASRTGKKHTAEHKANAVKNKAANRLLRQNAAIAAAGCLCADFVQRQ